MVPGALPNPVPVFRSGDEGVRVRAMTIDVAAKSAPAFTAAAKNEKFVS
jgi:hypothetical protein